MHEFSHLIDLASARLGPSLMAPDEHVG